MTILIFKIKFKVELLEVVKWSKNNKSAWICYQCSKDGPDYLFGDLRMSYIKDEPYFPGEIN